MPTYNTPPSPSHKTPSCEPSCDPFPLRPFTRTPPLPLSVDNNTTLLQINFLYPPAQPPPFPLMRPPLVTYCHSINRATEQFIPPRIGKLVPDLSGGMLYDGCNPRVILWGVYAFRPQRFWNNAWRILPRGCWSLYPIGISFINVRSIGGDPKQTYPFWSSKLPSEPALTLFLVFYVSIHAFQDFFLRCSWLPLKLWNDCILEIL